MLAAWARADFDVARRTRAGRRALSARGPTTRFVEVVQV